MYGTMLQVLDHDPCSQNTACQGDEHLQMKLKVTFCVDTLVSHFLQVLPKWRRA